MLNIDQQAPVNITLRDLDNKEVTLSDYFTKKYLVVYFYPQDNTTGCTIEACTFRDFNEEIKELDANIVGISFDSPESHKDFSVKNNLNFPLLSDENKELMTQFGVLIDKNEFGDNYRGVQRSTFLLDQTGKILHVWELVTKTEDHPKDVYEFIRNL